MNSSPAHILTETGVLTAFQVAKKVTRDEINKFISKQRKAGKKDEQISKLLKEKILREVQDALVTGKIPGLLAPVNVDSKEGLDPKVVLNMGDLNRLIMVITSKMVERQYDKMSMCYVINSMVNLLGLTEKDFEKFHRNRSKSDDQSADNDG